MDYYSKFPEIAHLNNTASSVVKQKLKEIFCKHGIPQTVISDNRPNSPVTYTRISQYNTILNVFIEAQCIPEAMTK